MSRYLVLGGLVSLMLHSGLWAQMPPLPMPPMPAAGNSMEAPVPRLPEAGGAQAGDGNPVSDPLRDPFWPVGYKPKPDRKVLLDGGGGGSKSTQVMAPAAPQWDEARKKLDVRGISLIGRDKDTSKPKFLAMVGGRLVEEGDAVTAVMDGMIYRWKVARISESGIAFQKVDVRAESN